MALDPNIALGVKPIELANPLAQYGMVSQIQHAQNQNAMAQLQMREAEAAAQERNALRQLNPSAPDYEAQLFKVNPQLGIAYRKEASAAAASKAQQQSHEVKTAQTRQEMLGQAYRDISGRPSDANIIAHTEDIQASDLFSAQEKQKALATQQILLSMPVEQRSAYLASQGAKSSELKPSTHVQNTGKTTQLLSVPAFGGQASVVPGSVATMHATPGEQLAHQDRVDKLSQETASGTWSPDSVEFAAQTYAQTGQMPPVGMGAKAMGVRDKILQRASEIARGINVPAAPGAEPVAPVDMATAAGNVTSAKQTKAAQAAAVRDFSAGMSARRVTANNTAINHLDTMEKLATDLGNSDLRVVNAASTAFAKATGASAPVNFDAARQLVAAEVIKAVVANGGGVKEREEAANQFARANSPAQLKGVVNTYKELLAGQLDTLGQQYETGTGRKDFESKLTPATKKVFETVRGKTETPAAGPIKISSDADYNKLPSGAMFIAPDGSQRRKP